MHMQIYFLGIHLRHRVPFRQKVCQFMGIIRFAGWNIYTTYKQFQHTTQWIQNNLENMYNSIKDLDHSNVPTGFTPQVRFNTTISFQEEKPDPLLATAEQSVKSYSTKISTTQTWASIAGNYSTGSSITPNSGLTKSIENLQNTLERMCKRLDKIEDFAQTRTGA